MTQIKRGLRRSSGWKNSAAEGSRGTLLQALPLDPTTDSYRTAVHVINEMFRLQGEVLPEMEW